MYFIYFLFIIWAFISCIFNYINEDSIALILNISSIFLILLNIIYDQILEKIDTLNTKLNLILEKPL